MRQRHRDRVDDVVASAPQPAGRPKASKDPSSKTQSECASPPATATTALPLSDGKHFVGAKTSSSSARPSWPPWFRPQPNTSPLFVTSNVWARPHAARSMGEETSNRLGASTWVDRPSVASPEAALPVLVAAPGPGLARLRVRDAVARARREADDGDTYQSVHSSHLVLPSRHPRSSP